MSCSILLLYVRSCSIVLLYVRSCSIVLMYVRSCSIVLLYVRSCGILLEVFLDFLALEDGTDTLSRNVGKQLLHDAA
jgi:hypothetical protein